MAARAKNRKTETICFEIGCHWANVIEISQECCLDGSLRKMAARAKNRKIFKCQPLLYLWVDFIQTS